jgi:hypothetical protein
MSILYTGKESAKSFNIESFRNDSANLVRKQFDVYRATHTLFFLVSYAKNSEEETTLDMCYHWSSR